MKYSALAQPHLTDPEPLADPRQRYKDVLVRAMGFAERILPRDQALEIAHAVATEMLRLSADRVSGSLIYIAVTRRLRSHWRSTQRRAAMEGAYHDMWSSATRLWAEPGAEMLIGELHDRITAVVDAMPRGMREVFLLVREEELSYKEAAARLGISVSTVHTQISRASALLRQCVAQYHADAPSAKPSRKASSHEK